MAWVLALVGLVLLAALHEVVRRVAAKRWRPVLAVAIAAAVHYFAIAALGFAFWISHGVPTGRSITLVGRLAFGFDAETKLATGDRVLAVDHVELGSDSVAKRVNASAGRPVVFTIDRHGSIRDVELQPKAEQGRWLVGIEVRRRPITDRDPVVAAKLALVTPATSLWTLVEQIQTVLLGNEQIEPGGPTRIVEESGSVWTTWQTALFVLLRFAVLALLLQLAVDAVRSRRS